MKFYTRISQSGTHCNVDISLEPDGPRLAARKRYDFEKGELQPAVVAFDVKFYPHPVDQIGEVIEWIEAARDVARRLDELIQTREDFKRRFAIVQSGWFVRLVEAEGSEQDGQ